MDQDARPPDEPPAGGWLPPEPAGAPLTGGWLPPEPAGPRPDLGSPKGAPPPPEAPTFPHAPPPGGGPPPQGTPPGARQPAASGWEAGYTEADKGNSDATAAFVLGVSANAAILFFMGVLFVVSIPLGILAIVFGRRGKENVDRGETRQHRGFAQAGLVLGIVSLPLSVLAVILWVLFFTDEDVQDELERDLDEDFSTRAVLLGIRTAVALARGLLA